MLVVVQAIVLTVVGGESEDVMCVCVWCMLLLPRHLDEVGDVCLGTWACNACVNGRELSCCNRASLVVIRGV